ncbi:class Ib ribonucleoside-diphosphate reductase assembly flavoprotein NrdI [Rhodobacteraceae bacterium]|nr:class Ib ribonucleoside-diphosphate reductase assembly flavoprotein NrdI [Paracoccaceae bacterium]
MGGLVFYSSSSGNTARFVERLGCDAVRIPISMKAEIPPVPDTFVLICPTFADGEGRGAVPKQVIRFLNAPERRAGLRGVIATGNRNFGTTYALAGRVIAAKCNIPLLYSFELAGTETDLARVKNGLDAFWETPCLTT